MGSTRRSFLKGVGGAAALGLIGNATDSNAEYGLFNGTQHKVLEIFMLGGFSYRDTLWIDYDSPTPPDYCLPIGTPQWGDCRWGDGATDAWKQVDWSTVDASVRPNGLVPVTIGGRPFGPVLNALVNGGGTSRSSLLPKTRVIAMKHEWRALQPHEAAVPYALTGVRLGRANFAGMASAFIARSPAALGTAFIFHSGFGSGVSSIYADFAAATGYFGAGNKPPVIDFSDDTFAFRLDDATYRNNVRGALDNYYTSLYENKLAGNRSAAFAGYRSGFDHVQSAAALETILSSAAGFSDSASSGPLRTRKMIRTAASLLKNTSGTTQYVGILEGGARGPMDTHGSTSWGSHATHHALNLWWVLAAINESFTPAELQTTVIVIHTEFGRMITHERSSHNPYGYAGLVIGGPTVAGAVGAIGATEVASNAISPLDLRCALYLAAQIEPFDTPIGNPIFGFKDPLFLNAYQRTDNGLNELGLTQEQLNGQGSDATLKTAIRQGLANTIFGSV
ncbi:MAG: DUF1501 domain-containing protein [Polyangiaceae bacterium]|nr:DUF1501 domain-containing protein [Polyangiaceae bacterium]